MTLEELRKKLREKTQGLDALKTKAFADGATAADLDAFNGGMDEIEGIQKQIDAMLREIKVRAFNAQDANTSTDEPQRTVHAQAKKTLKIEDKLGLVVQGLVKQKRGECSGVYDHIEKSGYGQVADEVFGLNVKALNSSIGVNGGFLIPPNMANEITDLLYPTTAFLRLGPMPIPMPNGAYEEPAGATGASASWTAEMQPATASEPTFRNIKMSAKALTSLVPMTRNFMDFTLPSATSWVQRNMLTVMSLEYDKGLIRGDGNANAPLGIYKLAAGQYSTATYSANTKTPTIAQIDATALALQTHLSKNNVPMGSAKWIMTNRVRAWLATVRNSFGVLVWPELEGENPRWKGYPVLVTTNLPENLGGSGDLAELAFVAGDYVLHGDVGAMEMLYSQEGTVVINGTVYSGIQHRMGFLVAVQQTDVNLRYLNAAALATDVQWGAP